MIKSSRPHDQVVVELLQNDPSFADEYLTGALDEANQPGGREALLAALRHIAEAARHGHRSGTRRNPEREPLPGIIHKRQSNNKNLACCYQCSRFKVVCTLIEN